MVNVLQVELEGFSCRFAEASCRDDGTPIGWVLKIRRGATVRFSNTVEFFTPDEDDWTIVPFNWEPT